MKKLGKKGFTLVELIATIVLLALVMGIGSYSITKVIENSKEKDYALLVDHIKDSLELYYQECRYSDDVIYSCYYDFNFDGKLNTDDAVFVSICINDGFSDSVCEYVNLYGDVDKNGVINENDSALILLEAMFDDDYEVVEKNKYFTSLNKLVSLGYLTGNGRDENNKYILVNSKTKEDIGNCVVSVEYNNGKFKIGSSGSIDNVNEDDCPKDQDYAD